MGSESEADLLLQAANFVDAGGPVVVILLAMSVIATIILVKPMSLPA